MFKARETTLRQLFDSGEYDQFIIPHYQRSYVWGVDELENFWNDFVIRAEGQGQLHLLGSIIISDTPRKDKSYGVVDGQQRLITCSLFIAALRDLWGVKYGYSDTDYYNLDRYIQKTDRSRGTLLKVRVAESLQEPYDSIVVAKSLQNLTPKSDDQKALIRAYEFFYSKLNELYDGSRTTEAFKKDLLWGKIENLFNSNIVLVTLEDEDDAYEVFEGFNARGVELSIADLFKNLILQKIGGNEDEKLQALEKWNEINQIVTELKIPKFNINTFLRYYWIRNHTYIGEKQLYKKIKKETKDYNKLLSQLYKSAQNLRIIFSDSSWDIHELLGEKSTYSAEINNSLRALRVMNTQSYMVWLMTLIDTDIRSVVSPKIIAKSLKQVEIFTFRYFAVSKLPSNRIEKLYANLSRELFEKVKEKDRQRATSVALESFKRIVEQDNLLPTREQFILDFDTISLQAKNKGFIRYLLTTIEHSRGTKEKTVDQQSVNIEHVLPQKPSKEWSITPIELKESVNRLGNLTILLEKINSSMSNKPIEQKIELLTGSELAINDDIVQMVKEKGAWGSSEIGQRQSLLAEQADEVWVL